MSQVGFSEKQAWVGFGVQRGKPSGAQAHEEGLELGWAFGPAPSQATMANPQKGTMTLGKAEGSPDGLGIEAC